jgi:malonate decarboxylase delta subunit
MESLQYTFGPWPKSLLDSKKPPVLVGVVGSGNLEILVEWADLTGKIQIYVETSVRGFASTWAAVLSDFAELNQFGNTVMTINDGGATPAVVSLRLAQAASEWSKSG